MAAELNNGSLSQYEQNRELVRRQRRRAGRPGPRCSSTGRTTGPDATARNARTSTARCRTTTSTRNEGFGKLTFTPMHSDPGQRQLPRLAPRSTRARLFCQSTARRRPAPATSRGRRSARPTARGSSTASSFAVVQVHALREPDAGPARQHRRTSSISTAIGTQLDIEQPRHDRAADRARRRSPGKTRTTPSSSRSSTGTATSANGVKTGGGTVGYGTQFDNDDFFRDAGQVGLQPRRSATGVPRHDLHVGYQRYDGLRGPAAQLERLGHRSRCRAAAPASAQRHADLLPGGVPAAERSARCRPSTPSTSRRTSRSTTRSASRTGRSTSACSTATTRSTARA